ncbi:MAG: hypothetical protein JSW63_06495 [Ignavibacterium sp.]|nr:MAG: hypothetical protein JSW63_06495 [Ignavibacterium sp.]
MSKLIFYIILLLGTLLIAQGKRYTKGTENGYTWISMEEPNLLVDESKSNYLSGMLERMRLEKQQISVLEELICKKEFYSLLVDGKSEEISMDDMVIAINHFYRNEENLVIPILLAYCYCIKSFFGMDEEGLEMYREKLLEFSRE